MELINKIPNLSRKQDLTPAPPLPEGKGSSGSWKLLAFDALSVLLAGAVGYSCLLYFSGGINVIFLAVLATLFLVASFFEFLFTAASKRRATVSLLQILAFLVFFYAAKLPVVLSAFGILVLFYFLAQRSTRSIADNSLKFKLGSLGKSYMKKLFTGLALAAIILYLPQWNSGNVFIPQPQFQKWYDRFAAVSERLHAGLDLTASVGTFAESVIRAQLATNDQFRRLPPEAQNQAVQKGIQEFIGGMSKNLGFALTPDTSLAEAFYHYLLNLFTNFQKQFGDSFIAAWAVALFVIVWSVGTLVMWLVVGVAYLVFEALLAFNVAHMAGETRTKEIVELS